MTLLEKMFMKTRQMKMHFGFLAIAVAVLFAVPQVSFAKGADDAVIATVNGDKIYKKDVSEVLKNIPEQAGDPKQIFPMVVEQIINEKLIDEASAAAKVEQNPEFQKQLDVLKSQLAKQFYVQEALKDKVSDKAIKAEYEKFKKENKGKEEMHARHILVPTEEEAKQVIKDLDAGAKFEDLAKQRSSGPTAQRGGDLGYFVKEEMIPEFSEAAFKLKPGTYTKTPVKTQFGWHVVKAEERRMRPVPEFKDIEAAIRNKLGQDALAALVEGLRAKADIKRFDESGKPVETGKN
jgi:peptidyl-prolyl cis-trans isomerase C